MIPPDTTRNSLEGRCEGRIVSSDTYSKSFNLQNSKSTKILR